MTYFRYQGAETGKQALRTVEKLSLANRLHSISEVVFCGATDKIEFILRRLSGRGCSCGTTLGRGYLAVSILRSFSFLKLDLEELKVNDLFD